MASERRKKILLVCISILFTLFLAEIALRILGIGAIHRGSAWFAGGNHPRFLFQEDSASGYTLRPGFEGREIAPDGEFDTEARIDSQGLRNHPHTAPARPLILALGDSMTFGEGVPVDRTWSATLERAAGIRVENGGVPGYSSRQMEGRGQRLIPALHPDVVLVMLSPHWDRQRCATPFVYLDGYIVAEGYLGRLYPIDGDLYLAETRLPVLGPMTAYAKRYSYVARHLLPALFGPVRAAVRREAPAVASGPDDYLPTAEALGGIQEQARRSGARFLTLLIDSRGKDYEVDRDGLETVLKERSIPYLALDTFLAKADWPRLRYARDQHWNEAGHRLVGTALASVVAAPVAPVKPHQVPR
jgi:lysophospholipase L1-like esterase